MTLQKEYENIDINIFLLADAVFCAIPNQKTPEGYYNIERMLKSIVMKNGKIKTCGGCSEARGIDELKFIEGVELSNMKELALWVVESDKVITFGSSPNLVH